MFIVHLHRLLALPLIAFSRPVPAGLIRVRSSKSRTPINPTAALIPVVVPDLEGALKIHLVRRSVPRSTSAGSQFDEKIEADSGAAGAISQSAC